MKQSPTVISICRLQSSAQENTKCSTLQDIFLTFLKLHSGCKLREERKLPQQPYANWPKVTSKPQHYKLATKRCHLQALLIIQDASAAVKCKVLTVLAHLEMQTKS